MNAQKINTINWIVVCVNEFARQFSLDAKTAFKYLYNYGGIDFLQEHYEAEHTLSFDEAVEDLQIICQNNGGTIV
jgi:TRAP-type mannitol/chloroaromatic compound transport system substrate-binding protein